MFILEGPYASGIMLDWLEESQHPVLDTEFARLQVEGGRILNLVKSAQAAERIDDGERLYTCSESALEWVLANVHEQNLLRYIRLCKDKAETRRALAAVDPRHFFRECTMDELVAIEPSGLPFPVVVKPAVGFISFGVHVVGDASAWDGTIGLLREEMSHQSVHPESVVGSDRFVVEGYLFGQEYAVDLYFDEEGEPVILDVLQHDFRDAEDASDHLYFTGVDIIRRAEQPLRTWFVRANETFGFHDFCMHAELRVSHAEGQDPIDALADPANVHVIELNPLRFAGLCGTDIAFHAYGIRTYEYYLADRRPDWDAVLDERGLESRAAMGVLEAPSGWKPGRAIDYEGIRCGITLDGALDNVYELRPLEPDVHGAACFPLFSIPPDEEGCRIRAFMLGYDPDEFLL